MIKGSGTVAIWVATMCAACGGETYASRDAGLTAECVTADDCNGDTRCGDFACINGTCVYVPDADLVCAPCAPELVCLPSGTCGAGRLVCVTAQGGSAAP